MAMTGYSRRIFLDLNGGGNPDVTTTSLRIRGVSSELSDANVSEGSIQGWVALGLAVDTEVQGPDLQGVPGEPTKADAYIEYDDGLSPGDITNAKKPLDDRAAP